MKRKRVWMAFAILLAAALSATIYIMVNFIDAETGFYADGGVRAGIISVCTAVAAVVLGVLSYKDSAISEYKPLNNAMAAAFSAFTGVFIIVQSISAFTVVGSSSAGTVAYRILSVLGFPAGIVFLTAAYDFASGTKNLSKHPLFALFPSIWGCMYLIMLFITYAAIVNSLSGLYNTCTAAVVLLFMFAQAKFITGIESEKSGRQIFLFGIPAAFLSLIDGISNCAVYFSGKTTSDVLPIGLQMLNILIGVYIISFLTAQKYSGVNVSTDKAQAVSGLNNSEEETSNIKQCEPAGVKNTDNPDDYGAAEKGQASGIMDNYIEFLSAAYPSTEKFTEIKESPFQD